MRDERREPCCARGCSTEPVEDVLRMPGVSHDVERDRRLVGAEAEQSEVTLADQ